jgi:hypothetical protein
MKTRSLYKMWTGIACSLLLLITDFNAFAFQYNINQFRVEGSTLSATDSLAIADVNIFIQGRPNGTVTNGAGNFRLIIHSDSLPFELTFSCLGYKTISINISNPADTGEPRTIFLEPSSYQLPEINIYAQNSDSAKAIIKAALQNVSINYPTEGHLIEGFFREATLMDTFYTRIVEASFTSEEKAYSKRYFTKDLDEVNNKIKLIQLRRSNDLRKVSLSSALFKKLFGERNELYGVMRRNYVRALSNQSQHFLSPDRIESYDYFYAGLLYQNTDTIHHIVITAQQNTASFRIEEFDFFINARDKAIVKIQHKALPKYQKTNDHKDLLIDNEFFDKCDVVYRKINRFYYPVYIRTIMGAYGSDISAEKDGRKLRQYTELTYLLTNVFVDKYKKVKARETVSQHTDLFDIEWEYDSVFWKKYTIPMLNPLTKSTSELEQQKSIEEQFKSMNEK